MRPRIFFYFCDLDYIDFFNFFGGIHGYFAINLEIKMVFMKCEKKKLKSLGHPAGDFVAAAGRRRFAPTTAASATKSPSGCPSGFNLFYFRTS